MHLQSKCQVKCWGCWSWCSWETFRFLNKNEKVSWFCTVSISLLTAAWSILYFKFQSNFWLVGKLCILQGSCRFVDLYNRLWTIFKSTGDFMLLHSKWPVQFHRWKKLAKHKLVLIKLEQSYSYNLFLAISVNPTTTSNSFH